MNNDFYENYHETTYEEDLAAQEKRHHSPIMSLILFLVKAWVLLHVVGVILIVVIFAGCYQAAKTGEDNLITETIVKVLEYAGEEVPEDKSLARHLHESYSEDENGYEFDLNVKESEEPVESSSEQTEESTGFYLPGRGTEVTEEPSSEPSSEASTPKTDNMWYLTLQVPEGSYFSITDNMNYVTHDIFDKRLVPLITDDRIKLAGIVEYETDHMVVMMMADVEAFTNDGVFDEAAAESAVYRQAETVLKEWYTIIGK